MNIGNRSGVRTGYIFGANTGYRLISNRDRYSSKLGSILLSICIPWRP